MKTTASLFTGGGLFDIGARQAGYRPIWGIELDDKIAAVARLNGLNVLTADVTIVNFADLEYPDHLHASPPCPNFSVAKAGAKETELDIALAESVCCALRTLRPNTFTLENVMAYRKSESFKRIAETLTKLGYFWDAANLNAADFGVPQTRRRLFVRASKNLLREYPAPVKWVGWYEAIEDLIQTLPDSQFAPWQIERLPKEFKESFITRPAKYGPEERGEGFYYSDAPAPTVKKQNTYMKAFIVDGQANENGKSMTLPQSHAPAFTITASQEKHPIRAFIMRLQNSEWSKPFIYESDPVQTIGSGHSSGKYSAYVPGRVVKMTIQALGRFQTVPDSYVGLTTKINGNGVPCKLAEVAMRTL